MTFSSKPGNPPDNQEELTALLSAYLDGALPKEESAQVENWLETDEDVKAAYERLLRLKHLTNRANVVSPLDVDDDSMWQSISGALKDDAAQVKANDLAAFDVEFISAYYDGEIARDDHDCLAFEQQLYHCELSNKTLAEIGQVSETVRRFGYRLEERCTVDFCEGVMSAYREEMNITDVGDDATIDMPLESPEWEKVSAHIRRVSAELEKQAPDLWPAIAAELGVENKNVVPFAKPARKTVAFKVWGPVAAAVFLIVLAVPTMNQQVNRNASQLSGSDMLSQKPMTAQEAEPAMETVGGNGSAGSLAMPQSGVETSAGMRSSPTFADLGNMPAELEETVGNEAKAKKESASKLAAPEPQPKPQKVAAEKTPARAKTSEFRRERDDAATSNMMADEAVPNRYEIATLPNRSMDTYQQRGMVRTGGLAGGAGGNFGGHANSAPAAAPVTTLNKARGQASSYDEAYAPGISSPASPGGGGAVVRQSAEIPSSEEFLINSLKEQMSDDEIEMLMDL